MTTVTYLFPNGAKVPTQAEMSKKFAAVHVTVAFADDDKAVDVTHNFQFEMAPPAPILPELPMVVINPISGGAKAPLWHVAYKDGNTVTIGKLAFGPDTALTLDVWLYRQKVVNSSFFGD